MEWRAVADRRLALALTLFLSSGTAAQSTAERAAAPNVAGAPRAVGAGGAAASGPGGPVENLDTSETFATIQAAIDDLDTLPGHTIAVAAGTYPENVWVDKRLTLLGAQAGTDAPGRVAGTPDPLVESVVAPPSGSAFTLVSGSAESIVDGFAVVGGDLGVELASGPIDQLQLLNCHFQDQGTGPFSSSTGAGNATLDSNAFHAAATSLAAVDLGPHDFDGLHFTGNLIARPDLGVGVGLSVDGFNNVGPSVSRAPLVAQNTVRGFGVGADLGTRSFTGGVIEQNEFANNGTGLGFGIQNSQISENLFAGNQRGLHLGSLGDADPTRGAFGDTVSGNQFLVSAVAGVELGATQSPGSIGTNVFETNCFEGNVSAVAYAGSELIDMEDNWWGDASGPEDPVGANPVGGGPCPPVPLANPGGLGDPLTGENVDYCPWLDSAVCQSLSILADDCQDDAFLGESGKQVVFELWMTDLGTVATGFQAFLEFDSGVLAYRGDLSTYSLSPFSLHIQDLLGAEVATGQLRLDGSTSFGGAPTQADALLATLAFDVLAECSATSLDFDLTQLFDSAVSYAGFELPTMLTDSPAIALDDTPPVFDPYTDITVAADAGSAGGCGGAVVNYPEPVAVDACPGAVDVACSPPAGSLFPVGTTTVSCTATDACGNDSVLEFDVTVTATNLVDVQLELPGVTGPVSRCIRLVADDCVTGSSTTVAFAAGFPATATVTIEIPCGSYSQVFAKDRQHTLWDGAPVVVSIDGSRYEALTPLVLHGGDTDDDGDVDVNDLTWFLAQFGDLSAAGGCPWDGVTRDADFSVNGAVGSEDYVFLSANWLAASSCGPLPQTGGGGAGLQLVVDRLDETTRRADLDRNGRIDHADVALFERRHGLPTDLSRALRAASRR